LCGLVDGCCEELGAPLHPVAALSYDGYRAQLVDVLGDRFESLAACGRGAPLTVASVGELAGR
jgi:hypothetical protein